MKQWIKKTGVIIMIFLLLVIFVFGEKMWVSLTGDLHVEKDSKEYWLEKCYPETNLTRCIITEIEGESNNATHRRIKQDAQIEFNRIFLSGNYAVMEQVNNSLHNVET